MWDEQFEQLLRTHLPLLPAGVALSADTDLRDFGLDSYGTVELLAELESTYRVRFANERLDLANFATPGVLWECLREVRALAG